MSWWLDETAFAGRENLDPLHVANYDAKEDAAADQEVRYLQDRGLIAPDHVVVDLGAGTGQFALVAARTCQRVYAVDVSPVMRSHLTDKIGRLGLRNVEVVAGGFLSYEHEGGPADLVYSRYALHHLPDFWKAQALVRIARMLRPGGILRLWDVMYHFDPSEAGRRLDAWVDQPAATDRETSWTNADLAEHVREEHSTYTWLLEPMIHRAGFLIIGAEYDDAGMTARYLCQKALTR